MITITIHIDRELFRWESFGAWCNCAARDFRRARAGREIPPVGGYLCVDAGGFVCDVGSDFMAARDAGRFPVVVYKAGATPWTG